MKTTTIRELKHHTGIVLGWVRDGETVEVRRRKLPVALLCPPPRKKHPARPDYARRLRAIYGATVLGATATQVVSDARGEA